MQSIREIGSFRVIVVDGSPLFRVQMWERSLSRYTDMPQMFGSLDLASAFCREQSAKLKTRYQLSGITQPANDGFNGEKQPERELTNDDMDAVCGCHQTYSDD